MDGEVLREWSLIFYFALAFLYLLFVHYLDRMANRRARKAPLSDTECLMRLARKKECSEYDIFFKATGSWNVPHGRVEYDFNQYLTGGMLPFYVRDFIRRHRKEIRTRS
jgi:hypothetical protein